MSWATIIGEFFAGLFSGVGKAKMAKAAGELEAGKREVKAVDANVEEIRHELAAYPKPEPAAGVASPPLAPVPAARITD